MQTGSISAAVWLMCLRLQFVFHFGINFLGIFFFGVLLIYGVVFTLDVSSLLRSILCLVVFILGSIYFLVSFISFQSIQDFTIQMYIVRVGHFYKKGTNHWFNLGVS